MDITLFINALRVPKIVRYFMLLNYAVFFSCASAQQLLSWQYLTYRIAVKFYEIYIEVVLQTL